MYLIQKESNSEENFKLVLDSIERLYTIGEYERFRAHGFEPMALNIIVKLFIRTGNEDYKPLSLVIPKRHGINFYKVLFGVDKQVEEERKRQEKERKSNLGDRISITNTIVEIERRPRKSVENP